jgi:hypothetical protein
LTERSWGFESLRGYYRKEKEMSDEKLHGNVIPISIARRQNNPAAELAMQRKVKTKIIRKADKGATVTRLWRSMPIREASKLRKGEIVALVGDDARRVSGVVTSAPEIKSIKGNQVLVIEVACGLTIITDYSNGKTMTKLLASENAEAQKQMREEARNVAV